MARHGKGLPHKGSRLPEPTKSYVRFALAGGDSASNVARRFGVSRDEARTVARQYGITLGRVGRRCPKCGAEL